MPRVVDHDERRARLAEAVWRISREEGVGALSVRRVGEAAGWSGGAVQYYFPTKTSLLQYAFDLVRQRTVARLREVAEEAGDDGALRQALMSLLPTDQDVSAESEVWFAFMGLALGDAALRSVAEEGHKAIVAEVRGHVVAAQEAGAIDARLDPDDVTTELVALCDGLCVQQLYRPSELSADQMARIVVDRLEALRTAPVAAVD